MPPIPNIQDLAKQIPAIASAVVALIGLITGLATQAGSLSSEKPGTNVSAPTLGKPKPGQTASWFDFRGGWNGHRTSVQFDGKIYPNSISESGWGYDVEAVPNRQYLTLTATAGVSDAVRKKYPSSHYTVSVEADGKTVFTGTKLTNELMSINAKVNYADRVRIHVKFLSPTGQEVYIESNSVVIGTPTFHT